MRDAAAQHNPDFEPYRIGPPTDLLAQMEHVQQIELNTRPILSRICGGAYSSMQENLDAGGEMSATMAPEDEVAIICWSGRYPNVATFSDS